MIICLLFGLICNPIIGLWWDFCNCYCSIKKKYKNIRGHVKNFKILVIYEYICSDNIWENVNGMSVETINKNKISVCLNCKRELELINFLPKEK